MNTQEQLKNAAQLKQQQWCQHLQRQLMKNPQIYDQFHACLEKFTLPNPPTQVDCPQHPAVAYGLAMMGYRTKVRDEQPQHMCVMAEDPCLSIESCLDPTFLHPQ